jgi:hypothetical protein
MSGENWYTRLGGWDNRIYARLLSWLAAGTSMLATLCRGKTRAKIEGAACLLRNLALSVARPEAARLMASPQLLKKALIETVGFTALITLVAVWTLLSVYGFLTIAVVPVTVLVVVLCFLFTQLINLLALSGDMYQQSQDEGQRLIAHQASATTLRVVGCVLVALSLCLAFLPGWRTWVAIDLSALALFARMFYLARLTQLRWAALALVELEDETEALAEGT